MVYPTIHEETMDGFTALPSNGKMFSAVLLIHEIFGVTKHIRTIADRLASAGYIVYAVNLYSRDGVREKSFSGVDEMRQFIGALPYEQMMEDIRRSIALLSQHPNCNGNVSIMGLCMGGALAMRAAAMRLPISSAAVFYGRILDPIEQLEQIQVPLIAFYGEQDSLMQQVEGFKRKLDEYGKTYELYTYPDANHAFLNEDRDNFNAPAAADSWVKLLLFLEKNSIERN